MARSTQASGRTLRGVRHSVLFTLLGSLAACSAPGGTPLATPDPQHGSGTLTPVRHGVERMPEWANRPHSWEKLQSINAWLAGAARSYNGYWVVEGHLQLSEGRLRFAESEPVAASTRLADARQGFRRVLAHPDASATQVQRAEFGLANADRGVFTPPSPEVITGVVPRARWGARGIVTRRLNPAQGDWRYITIHHSVYPDARSTSGSLASSASAIRRIQAEHMDNQGFGDVGYHYFIDPSGRVFEGRDLRWRGAHADGANNYNNIGICLIGNFEVEHPTRQAVASMHSFIAQLSNKFGVSERNVEQHSDWKNTACPGEFLRRELARYR